MKLGVRNHQAGRRFEVVIVRRYLVGKTCEVHFLSLDRHEESVTAFLSRGVPDDDSLEIAVLGSRSQPGGTGEVRAPGHDPCTLTINKQGYLCMQPASHTVEAR